MNRRTVLIVGALGVAALAAAWFGLCSPFTQGPWRPSFGQSTFDRAIFVCVDNDGTYSPGVYLHGTGEPAGLRMVPLAAPFMRTPEVGDAAAGLFGFHFKYLGDDPPRGGALSLYDAQKAAGDGTVDWQTYCGANVDFDPWGARQGGIVFRLRRTEIAEEVSGAHDRRTAVRLSGG